MESWKADIHLGISTPLIMFTSARHEPLQSAKSFFAKVMEGYELATPESPFWPFSLTVGVQVGQVMISETLASPFPSLRLCSFHLECWKP